VNPDRFSRIQRFSDFGTCGAMRAAYDPLDRIPAIRRSMSRDPNSVAFGLYSSGVDLHALAGELNHAGFSSEGVCVLLPMIHPVAQTIHALRVGALTLDSAPELETVLKWIARFGAVVIPGVGLFVSGREFSGTLFGSNKKPHSGRVLEDLGVSWPELQRYEDWVSEGGVLVYVCCDTYDESQRARAVLQEASAAGSHPLDAPPVCLRPHPHTVSLAS
jgi:hypothetical protein